MLVFSPAAGGLDDNAKRARIEQLYEEYRGAFAGVQELSAERVMALASGRRPLVLVDARTAEEQAVSMLPGAIGAKQFLSQLQSTPNAIVVGYCTIGYRSGELARKLQSRGIAMINLRGGILAWLHAGGTVESAGQPVRRVHVYGASWDLAPAGYEAIW